MKKRTLMMFAGIVMAFALTACTSIETSKNFNGLGMTTARSKPVAHINARISGVFLFDAFPLFCGSVNNIDKVAAFVNTVSMDNALGLLTRHARGLGATKLVNLNSYYQTHWLWYTILLWERKSQVSATAIK
ncbi:MAG: hypothetical protein KAS17_08305 [Victivallaceae bacterium]|nr:hypothetical protein [Victivallaceae bacterium]